MSACFNVNNSPELMTAGLVSALIREYLCYPVCVTSQWKQSKTQHAFVNMYCMSWSEVRRWKDCLPACSWLFISTLCLITFTALHQTLVHECVCVRLACVPACHPADRDHIAPWKPYTVTARERFTVQSKYSHVKADKSGPDPPGPFKKDNNHCTALFIME